MKIVAIVCGNIRDIIDFKLTLTRLTELRAAHYIHHIIFSTWEHELDAYPELSQQLKEAQIDVVETLPLPENFANIESNSVNYWRQARQLQSALDAIEGECFILKARTDRCLNFLNQIDWSSNFMVKTEGYGAMKPIFEYKMSVFSPKTVRLFNMNDFIFIAYKYDAYKLINFDIPELLLDRDIVANTQWYIYPFFKAYPVLRDYFRLTNYRPMVAALKSYVDQHKEAAEFPDFLYKVYAVYLGLLYINFNIMGYDRPMIPNNIQPRHFYQLFTSLESNEVLYTNIGSTLRANRLVADFFEPQFFKSSYLADQKLADYLHKLKYETLFFSKENFEELQRFQREQIYNAKWLKGIKTPPRIQLQDIAPSQQKHTFFSGAEKSFEALAVSKSFDKDLYRLWLKSYVSPRDSITYLLSHAKSGALYPILHLIRMLRQGLIEDGLKAEVMRFSLYFPTIKDVRKNFEFHFLLVVVNVFLLDSSLVEARRLLLKYAHEYLHLELEASIMPKDLYRLAQEVTHDQEKIHSDQSELLRQFCLEIAWNVPIYHYLKGKNIFAKEYVMISDRYPA